MYHSTPTRRSLITLGLVLAGGCSPSAPPSTSAPPDLAPAPLPTIPMGTAHARQPPAHTVGGFSIELPELAIAPGAETFHCYTLPIDIKGPSRLVGGGVLRDTTGLHHGNVTSRPIGSGANMPVCDPNYGFGEAEDFEKGGAVLFASTTAVAHEEWLHLPDGMAYRVPEGNEAVFRMHYLNASDKTITVKPRYEWFTVDEATLKQELAPFAWKVARFTIPAHSDYTARSVCDFKAPMHVVSVLPHMHRMGRSFTAGFASGPLDGKLWLDSKGYDPEGGVMQVFDPSVDLSQGQEAGYSVSYACSWHNDLDFAVHEGVGDNEMCVLFGYAWPPGAAFTVLSGDGWCQLLSGGAP